jgi:hypothetical protein
VQIKIALPILMLGLIIKNIVLMNVAGLLPTRGSWKNIMRKKPLRMEQPDYAKSAQLN